MAATSLLPEPNARATAVFIDEFDAGRFECEPYRLEGRTAWRPRPPLEVDDGFFSYTGLFGQVLLRHVHQTTSRLALGRS